MHAPPLVSYVGEMLAFMKAAGMHSAWGVEYQPGPDKAPKDEKPEEKKGNNKKKKLKVEAPKFSRAERMVFRDFQGIPINMGAEEAQGILHAMGPSVSGLEAVSEGR